MDLGPIQQLQNLSNDRSKMLEKISSIHAPPGSHQTAGSSELEPAGLPASAAPSQAAANPISEDPLYGRLLQALRDMQWQIEERVRPIAQQAVDLEAARLREQSDHEQAALRECLAEIDRCISTCAARLDECQEKHDMLATLNERLATLGAAPELLPENLPKRNLSDTLQERLEELRHQGKL